LHGGDDKQKKRVTLPSTTPKSPHKSQLPQLQMHTVLLVGNPLFTRRLVNAAISHAVDYGVDFNRDYYTQNKNLVVGDSMEVAEETISLIDAEGNLIASEVLDEDGLYSMQFMMHGPRVKSCEVKFAADVYKNDWEVKFVEVSPAAGEERLTYWANQADQIVIATSRGENQTVPFPGRQVLFVVEYGYDTWRTQITGTRTVNTESNSSIKAFCDVLKNFQYN
jgi:hypothetical protein